MPARGQSVVRRSRNIWQTDSCYLENIPWFRSVPQESQLSVFRNERLPAGKRLAVTAAAKNDILCESRESHS
jgi:hypothetical protein